MRSWSMPSPQIWMIQVSLLFFIALLTASCSAQDTESIALFSAIQRGDLNSIKSHIEAGKSIEAQDSSGRSLLYVAALYGNEDIVEYLLLKGADPNIGASWKGMETPLHATAGAGQTNSAELLLKHGANVDAKSYSGVTALHRASWNLQNEVVRLLIEHHADVNARDKMGCTPMILPAPGPIYIKPGDFSNYKATLTLLVNNGSDVNAKSFTRGDTPLICAAWAGDEESVVYLLSAGADPSIKSKYGTALEYAQRVGHTKIVSLLENAVKRAHHVEKVATPGADRENRK